MAMIADVIARARAAGRKIGICGQAPSDYPEFARFLVATGINSMSLNSDTVIKTTLDILKTEKSLLKPSKAPAKKAVRKTVKKAAAKKVRIGKAAKKLQKKAGKKTTRSARGKAAKKTAGKSSRKPAKKK
jgi:phosphoenolpyruvate-protein kinase (PTS system EI component)